MNPIHTTPYLYIVRCNDAYKVGVSTLPEQRIALIRTDNYQPVQTIAIIGLPDAYRIEKEPHELFKEQGAHIRGEWFKLPEELVAALPEALVEALVE